MLPPSDPNFKMFKIVLNSGESFSIGGKLSEIDNLERHVIDKTYDVVKVHGNTIRTSQIALILR
jgi:hypothetical protein